MIKLQVGGIMGLLRFDRPISIEYEPGSFEECEVTVQAVQASEYVIDLASDAIDPAASLYRFRVRRLLQLLSAK